MRFVAKTLYGLEQVLSDELNALGAENVTIANRAVTFSGDKTLLYRVNYCSRTALSVLMQIADFRIRSKEDLYKGASRIEWERYLDPESSFAVTPVVNSGYFSHSGYPALLFKDAVADRFRKKSGSRPSVDTTDPDILINLHISNDQVNVSLDSSVIPLFKRGYREEQGIAPLNEVLAAGILMLAGWNGMSQMLDPMCGSGTFPIEAALIACNIPPGKFRTFYGFSRWKDFDEELFDEVRNDSEKGIKPPAAVIMGCDISEAAVINAGKNARNAGVNDIITFKKADFRSLDGGTDGCTLFLNPPYGQRLNTNETDELYSMIGSTLKHKFAGSEAWLITSNKDSLRNIGLKPSGKYILYNGALECTLLNYRIYSGSRKTNKQ